MINIPSVVKSIWGDRERAKAPLDDSHGANVATGECCIAVYIWAWFL